MTSGNRSKHPVWEVYDLLRTCKLSERYYQEKAARTRRIEFYCEVALAITASSSAIAALPVWTSPGGHTVWGVLTTITAVIAVVKPFLKLSDRMKVYENLCGQYRRLVGDLMHLKRDIATRQCYDDAAKARFEPLSKEIAEASDSEYVESLDKKLRSELQEEVNRLFPALSFYVPDDD